MAVKDPAGLRIEAELLKDLVCSLFLIDESVLRDFVFFVGSLISNEVTLKCRHLILAEQR